MSDVKRARMTSKAPGILLSIEFRDLQWALAASRHRSLRQAAESLNIRQSTLSRHLRELECSLGAELFDRTNAGTRPTVVGQEFLEAASRIIEDTKLACIRVRSRCAGETGLLRVGTYCSFAAGNLWSTLVEHRRRFPNVDLRTVDGSFDRLLCDLMNNNLDVVIGTTTGWGHGWSDRMLPLWSERVIVALPSYHPLSSHSSVRWCELRDETLLLPQGGPAPEFEHLLATKLQGAESLRVQRHAAALDHLLSLVSTGYGVLLVFEGATGASYNGVVYREIDDGNGPTRHDFVACWRDANGNPTLGPFLDMLRERYPDLSSTDLGE